MALLRHVGCNIRIARGKVSSSSMSPLSTLATSGIKAFPDTALRLLPLLEPEESRSGSAPLSRLSRTVGSSNSNREKARLAFHVDDGSGGSTEWFSSVHVFPSAYPRSHPASTSPPSQSLPKLDSRRAALDKAEERRAREADFSEWDTIAKRYSIESFFPPASDAEAQEQARNMSTGKQKQPQLWTTVQRLVPKRPVKTGVTLFLAHANGFHKELYEPTMQALLNSIAKRNGPPIAEIWSMDSVDSGDAGIINRDHLGLAVSWFDQPRDMLQFLDYYMPQEPTDTPNLLLTRNAQGAARKRRNLVGVGHSFNGAGMMMLSSLVPDCFQGVFIIDPVGTPPSDFPNLPIPAETTLGKGAIARKDIFSSRSAAQDYMSSRAFFTSWDPRVLNLHLRYGLQPLPGHEEQLDPPVTLCQSKWREALAYSSYFSGTFSFAQVEKSLFKGWGHLICMSDSEKVFFGERGSEPLLANFSKHFSKRASSEVLPGGHLVVLQQPDKLGDRLAQVLSQYHAKEEDKREFLKLYDNSAETR